MRLSHRTARPSPRLLAALVLAAAIGACAETTVCTLELGVYLAPQDTTLRVGESVAPTVRLSSCGGRERLRVRSDATSLDTTIVRIESAPLRLRAVAPGRTDVLVTDSAYGSLGLIAITVTPVP